MSDYKILPGGYAEARQDYDRMTDRAVANSPPPLSDVGDDVGFMMDEGMGRLKGDEFALVCGYGGSMCESACEPAINHARCRWCPYKEEEMSNETCSNDGGALCWSAFSPTVEAGKRCSVCPYKEEISMNGEPGLPPNPKQAYGDLKVPVHLVPPASVMYEAIALAEGARKYEPYNWREKSVEAMTYIAAALRHIYAYLDGEEYDPEITERQTHHLGLAKASLGILADCIETGNLIDNRPPKGNAGKFLRENGKLAASQR